MHGGYVLNFSDRSFSGFFDDEFGITIYCEKYNFNGSSKAKHMQAFIKTDDEYTVARVLRRFWEERESRSTPKRKTTSRSKSDFLTS
jgi:hypothetical protein